MTDWQFAQNEVVKHTPSGDWWHVLGRYEEVDSGEQRYRLADATHTEYKEAMHAEDVEDLFESDGWQTTEKPASVNGYRVNGVLCGPSAVDYWKNHNCHHKYTCPNCGEEGMQAIDVIHSFEDGDLASTTLECRSCGYGWEG